jgi:hypothetical protein
MAELDLIENILRWKYGNWEFSAFDVNGLTKWQWMVQYPENLRMGKYLDIGAFTYINAQYGIVLEDFVQIGSLCSIFGRKTEIFILSDVVQLLAKTMVASIIVGGLALLCILFPIILILLLLLFIFISHEESKFID